MGILKGSLIVTGVALLGAAGLFLSARSRLAPMDEEARANAPGEFVDLSAGRAHYQWHGPEDGPVVVLVHGFSTPSFVWRGLLPELRSAGLRILSYDHFGRGWSDRPKAEYDAAFYEDQLLELLASQSVTEPVALVGYSMGGAISTHFAANHPDRVSRLALIAPAGFPVNGGGSTVLLGVPVLGDWLMTVFGRQILLETMSRPENQGRALPDLLERYEEQLQYAGYLPALLSTMRHFPMGAMAAEFEAVGRSGIPVFSIWGGADETIPIENAEHVRKAIPDATIEIIEAGTHAITYSEPERVAKGLADFLRP